jgi:hypothetical protein
MLLSQVSFPLVLLILNQWCTPPIRLQVSDCSTFLIMCDVPGTGAFFRECFECFTGFVYRFFSSLVTIPVAPMITGIMKHFIFCIY